MLRSLLLLVLLAGCSKTESPEPVPVIPTPLPEINTEADLFVIARFNSQFLWYKNDSSRLPSANASAHSSFMRVRFNAIAAAALTDNGKLPVGGSFPRGSLVVKELFEGATDSLRYLAVMYKDSLHPEQADGWVWGEFESNGVPLILLNSKGALCVSCHQTADRDRTRLFDLHP